MINKILVFWGIAILAILLIENMVMPYNAYVLWFTSKTFTLSLVSALTWVSIWYWIRWYTEKANNVEDEVDF